MKQKNLFLAILGILFLAGIAGGALNYQDKRIDNVGIKSFDDCVAAGNPVMESFPRQCRTSNGKLFVEKIIVGPKIPNLSDLRKDECVPAGCSSQLCVEASVADDVVTTCEYRAEYACYENATCERQNSGECGWTPTPDLQMCLESAQNSRGIETPLY